MINWLKDDAGKILWAHEKVWVISKSHDHIVTARGWDRIYHENAISMEEREQEKVHNQLFVHWTVSFSSKKWVVVHYCLHSKIRLLQRVHLISNRLIKAYDSYSCSRTGSTLLTSCKKIMCKSIHWLTDWPTNWHIDMKTFPMVNANRREEKFCENS